MVGLIKLNYSLLDCYFESSSYEEAVKLVKEYDLFHEFYFENLFYVPNVTRSPIKNKCKSEKSRTEAFKLLYKVVKKM